MSMAFEQLMQVFYELAQTPDHEIDGYLVSLPKASYCVETNLYLQLKAITCASVCAIHERTLLFFYRSREGTLYTENIIFEIDAIDCVRGVDYKLESLSYRGPLQNWEPLSGKAPETVLLQRAKSMIFANLDFTPESRYPVLDVTV